MAIMFAAVLAAALTGCGPNYYWVKPEATQTDWQLDSTECRAYASRAVPANHKLVELSSAYQTPARTSCASVASSLSCTTTGGEVVPAKVIAYDANDQLRNEAVAACMYRKGWRLVASDHVATTRAQADQSRTSVAECQTDRDCGRGRSCRSRSGGGTECRLSNPGVSSMTMDCQFESDCPRGQSCRSRTGGGTECR